MCFKWWLRNWHLIYRACVDPLPKHKPLYLVSGYFILISKCWSYSSEKNKNTWGYLDNSTNGIITHCDKIMVYYWKKNALPNSKTFVSEIKKKKWDQHDIFVLKYIVLWWLSISLDSRMLNNPVQKNKFSCSFRKPLPNLADKKKTDKV